MSAAGKPRPFHEKISLKKELIPLLLLPLIHRSEKKIAIYFQTDREFSSSDYSHAVLHHGRASLIAHRSATYELVAERLQSCDHKPLFYQYGGCISWEEPI